MMDKIVTNIIIQALRRLWLIRGANRKAALHKATIIMVEGRLRVARVCQNCGRVMRDKENGKRPYEIDHVLGVRSGPWDIGSPDWNLFVNRLFYGECVLLCRACHKDKTHKK
jgi:5-methylcytosine-specific restriction endonuclease McrA